MKEWASHQFSDRQKERHQLAWAKNNALLSSSTLRSIVAKLNHSLKFLRWPKLPSRTSRKRIALLSNGTWSLAQWRMLSFMWASRLNLSGCSSLVVKLQVSKSLFLGPTYTMWSALKMSGNMSLLLRKWICYESKFTRDSNMPLWQCVSWEDATSTPNGLSNSARKISTYGLKATLKICKLFNLLNSGWFKTRL